MSAVALKLPAGGWPLWSRQIGAILGIELRKNFLSRRSIIIYLLALVPIGILSLLALVPPSVQEFQNLGTMRTVFSGIYEGLILRTIVFFGCAWIFMNLFRAEIIDKSLHYYFLSPVRREVLVAGKYLSGIISSILVFSLMTAASYALLFLPRGSSMIQQLFVDGDGVSNMMSYVLITVLGCVGYGAAFMVIGLFFRNPIIPAVVAYGWEFINFLLPPLLKKISVIHYLRSLNPIPMSEGPFAVVADPTPAYVSIPGLIIVTAIVLIIAGVRIRKMEITYAGE